MPDRPHAPYYSGPEIARRRFKERLDALTRAFLTEVRDLDFEKLMGDAAGRNYLDRRYAAFVMRSVSSPKKEVV
jgi:hypothetical protein